VGLCLAVWVLIGLPVHADTAPAPRLFYSRDKSFLIPFKAKAGDRPLSQVNLYYSPDQGQHWEPGATARPADNEFSFTAPRDGLYWFTVCTIDTANRRHPESPEQGEVMLHVVVDTQPPRVDLRVLPPRPDALGVQWDVSDDNLDLNTLRLDYRAPGGPWQPLTAEKVARGQCSWAPPANPNAEVRLEVQDKAGNKGGMTVAVGPGNTARPVSDPQPAAEPANQSVKIINVRTLTINYKPEVMPKSDIKAVDLYVFDYESRKWEKKAENRDKSAPSFTVMLPKDGLWGFTLIAHSGADKSEPPPRSEDPPQYSVEVDTVKPVVSDVQAVVGTGVDQGTLTITWKAKDDKGLRSQPIALFWAETREGDWHEIKKDLENREVYRWTLPSDLPWSIYIKVEAVDRAGNKDSYVTEKPVAVDLVVPKVRVFTIETVPGGRPE
jgi:hypothetical protein